MFMRNHDQLGYTHYSNYILSFFVTDKFGIFLE